MEAGLEARDKADIGCLRYKAGILRMETISIENAGKCAFWISAQILLSVISC